MAMQFAMSYSIDFNTSLASYWYSSWHYKVWCLTKYQDPGVSSSMYFRMPEATDRDVFMLLYSLYNDVQNNILCMVVSIASRSSQ